MLSAPHFGPPAPTEDFRPKLGTLFTIREPEANMRAQSHGLREKSKVHRERRRRAVRRANNKESRKRRSWHCGTIHHRITGASKGAQYGTLKIPLGAKVTNDTSERAPEPYRLGQDTPDLSRTPFLTGLREARPTDK
ncbi:hypothetical protein CDL15_Pgr020627 [Punica granatum]|uniref:Uncharacterized protein n=1 Tax=Punica granatum TaxID=22663 RepID=A0A218XNR5_PUNGR|nr:hypothetical protein CDL15_Pgr020627 [Punica granatum]